MTRALHAQLTGGRLLAALIVAGALAMRRSRPRHRAVPRPPAAPAAHFHPFTIVSPNFRDGGFLPVSAEFGRPGSKGSGCSGKNLAPTLTWYNMPAGTKSFVLAFSPPRATTYTGTCVGITGRVGRPLLGTCSRLQPPAPARRAARMTNLRATAGLAPSSRSRTDRRVSARLSDDLVPSTTLASPGYDGQPAGPTGRSCHDNVAPAAARGKSQDLVFRPRLVGWPDLFDMTAARSWALDRRPFIGPWLGAEVDE